MKKKKTQQNIKNLILFIQDSFDDFITIVLWVILWSIIEPYITNFSVGFKLSAVLIVIVFLNKRLLKFPKKQKKSKKKRTTFAELAEKIEDINNRI